MEDRIQTLVDECKRQEESCLYTSTTFYEWLKRLYFYRQAFIVIEIVLGGISFYACPLLTQCAQWSWVSSFCGLLAGVLPAIFRALGFDQNLASISKSAVQFKILQDRFRQAHLITALADFEKFSLEFRILMERMDNERDVSPTPPERYFKKAKKKIDK